MIDDVCDGEDVEMGDGVSVSEMMGEGGIEEGGV